MDRLPRQLSSTAYPIEFLMVLSIDHITAATGKTVTVTISKNGAAFGASAGAITEIANGLYAYAGNATDRNTLGPLAIHATATGCDPVDFIVPITTIDPFAAQWGLTALPNVIAGASGGLPLGDASGRVDVGKWLGSAVSALISGRVDSTIGAVQTGVIAAASFAANALDAVWTTTTRALSASGVQAIWDALTTALTTPGSIGKWLLDNAGGGSAPTVQQIVDGIWDAPNADHTDDGSQSQYLAEIKAKTDRLGEFNIAFQSPTLDGGVLAITKGQTYNVDFNLDVEYTLPLNGPDPTDWDDVVLLIQTTGTPLPIVAADVNTTTGLCKWNLTPAQSESANGRRATIYIELLNGDVGDKWIPFNGTMNVTETLVSSL